MFIDLSQVTAFHGEGICMSQKSQEQCHQEDRLLYESGLLINAETSDTFFRINSHINRGELVVPRMMVSDNPLEGSYWAINGR